MAAPCQELTQQETPRGAREIAGGVTVVAPGRDDGGEGAPKETAAAGAATGSSRSRSRRGDQAIDSISTAPFTRAARGSRTVIVGSNAAGVMATSTRAAVTPRFTSAWGTRPS